MVEYRHYLRGTLGVHPPFGESGVSPRYLLVYRPYA